MKLVNDLNDKLDLGGITSIYRWLFANQKTNKWPLVILVLTVILNILTVCINPVIFKTIFDSILPSKNVHLLLILISIIFTLYLISVIATFVQSNIAAKIAAKIINKTRLKLFYTIQEASLDEGGGVRRSELLSSATQDINFLEYTVSYTVWLVAQYFSIGLISALFLFYVDFYMTLLVIVLIPLAFIISNHFLKITKKMYAGKRKIQSQLFLMEEEGASMQDIIRYLRIKNYKRKQFKDRLKDAVNIDFIYNSNLALAARTTVLGVYLITLIILGLGVYRVILDDMTIGALISFLVLLGNIGSSINFLSSHYPNLVQGNKCLSHINALFNTVARNKLIEGTIELGPLQHSIVFKNVNVKYGDDEVISNINLSIYCGQYVALVGQSGSGKSTLLKLILREIPITAGEILFDGIDIRKFSLNSIYSQIGIVQQNPRLFNASIKENIRLGKLSATDDEIIAAAKLAEIHEDIMSFPKKYDTVVTEKNLSAGQYRRVAIARTLIAKPSIIGLDEATMSLDPVTAHALDQTFDAMARKFTIISVTHQLRSTVNNDKIFVIDKGRLIEEGTHDTLIQMKGRYYKFWEKQHSVLFSDDMTNIRISAQGLKSIPMFSSFDDKLINTLIEEFSLQKMAENTIVFEEGDLGDKFYVIASGVIEVSKLDKTNNKNVVVSRLSEGDFFGEIALLYNIPRTARITTLSPCIFLTLDSQQFQRIVAILPESMKKYIMDIVKQRIANEVI